MFDRCRRRSPRRYPAKRSPESHPRGSVHRVGCAQTVKRLAKVVWSKHRQQQMHGQLQPAMPPHPAIEALAAWPCS
eukprot:5780700-Pleurochrysis_carterae.AAC.4